MKKLDVPQSGSQSSTVASRNRFGQYDRTRATPIQPRTPRQVYIRGILSAASQAWRGLSDATRAQWNNYAAQTPSSDSLGQTVFKTGLQQFVGLYVSLNDAGLSVPPGVPTSAPPAAPGLVLTAITAPGTITVTVTGTVDATHVLILDAAPLVSAGVTFNGDYRFISKFATLSSGVGALGAPYVLKFGSLIAGRRLFVRGRVVTAAGGASAPTLVNGIST